MKLVCRLVGLGGGDLGLPILLATDADCDRADRKWTMGGHAGGKRIHGETHRSDDVLLPDGDCEVAKASKVKSKVSSGLWKYPRWPEAIVSVLASVFVLTLSTDEPQLISDSVVWVEESSDEASVGS